MKAKLYAVAVAALMSAACFTSCTNDEVLPEQTQNAVSTCPDVIYVNFDQATRVVMGEGNKPMWEKRETIINRWGDPEDVGDEIVVYCQDAEGRRMFADYHCTDPLNGRFEINSDGWHDYETYEQTSSLPVGQAVVTTGGFIYSSNSMFVYQTSDCSLKPGDLRAAYLIGTTPDLSKGVTLKNIMALLKVTVKEGSKLTYVGVEASFKESGEYVLGSETPWTNLVDAEELTVVKIGWPWYHPEDDETIDNVDELVPGDYYIPIIPQTLSGNDGPSLTLYWSDAKEAYNWCSIPSTYRIQEKRSSFTLEAGKIYDLGVLD